MNRRLIITTFVGLVVLAGVGLSYRFIVKSPPSASLGLVVTSIDNPYFVEMINGAKGAASQSPALPLNVEAPEEGAVDPERQQQLIESLIASRVSVLLVVPADSTQVISSIIDANNNGIPFIVLDNDVNRPVALTRGAKSAAFIGSDNVAGGKLAGDTLIEKLGPAGGQVAILEGVPGVEAAIERKAGFVQTIAKQPTIVVVASQAANWDREKAYNVTQAILLAHPAIKAIFACNDEMALGAIKALGDAKRKDIIVIGYDATPDGRKAVANGSLYATIAQQPVIVGQLGVQYARRLLAGESVPAITSVPLQVIMASKSSL